MKKEKLDFYRGTKEQFLRSSFAQPIATDKLKILASRSFDELDNVTTDMETSLSRILTDGLAQGKSPLELSGELEDQVGFSSDRARTVARTEIIRAHAEGQLMALRNLGIEQVGVAVEWSTTGDEKVCPKCQPLEGIVLTIDEAEGLLPRHPNCRCAWIPANVGEVRDQVRSKKSIEKRIEESTGGEEDWGPIVSKHRPKSIFNASYGDLIKMSNLIN
jgi:SPP1 gp7 family putative phage head morphogenesis protein